MLVLRWGRVACWRTTVRRDLSGTHQHPLYPSELDHSFGIGRFFCRSLLGRGQLLTIGETIFKRFLNKRNIALGQDPTAAGAVQEPSQMENREQRKAVLTQRRRADGDVTIQTTHVLRVEQLNTGSQPAVCTDVQAALLADSKKAPGCFCSIPGNTGDNSI